MTASAELPRRLTAGKFFAINLETVTRQVRVPEPARFAAVILEAIAGEPVPEAVIAEGTAAIAPFVDGDQLVFPMSSLIAVGRVKT